MSHAVLSPSAASRWMACTPSARLELEFTDKAGDFAEEGTLAHEVGETILLRSIGKLTKKQFNDKIRELSDHKFYSPELRGYAEAYATYVWEKYLLARKTTKDAILRVEEKLDLTEYAPESFGTGDAVIIADGTMRIIDLKYGKGVPVSAVENKQMMMYALGAITMFGFQYDIRNVRMIIYQPRLDNISVFEMPVGDLLLWGENELKPKAQMAFNGEGNYMPGPHCRFCKAKAQCKAHADMNMELAKYDFKDAALLTADELADILSRGEQFKTWLTAVEDYALQAALEGKKFPGYKLVEGRSVRKYVDEKEVAKTLLENGFTEAAIYEPAKLKTITNMEKAITKKAFTVLLSELIIKPQGKPTLVPESDKRQEYNSIDSDFSNVNIND